MAILAEVNKDSVVYDCCTGTGGLLVSAMKMMIADAGDNQKTISNIKTKQLIGVERAVQVFALACSNMFIHQDGKTAIINGSCFDEDVVAKVAEAHPTVALLNPPYKANKKQDIDEYEFILNALDAIQEGGKCVAIVPMQCALAQSGKVGEYKRRVLESHTLDAVFSMPDELFFNSQVGVVSCIMVFTAKRPHPLRKKVYFGYYKKDGFTKNKTKGRVDSNQTFQQTIKNTWLTTYHDREEVPGLSVKRSITAKDEWCAEAYMDTDYSTIKSSDFSKTVLLYVGFLILSQKIENAIKQPIIDTQPELHIERWRMFELTDLFSIKGSKTTSITDLVESGPGGYPFVTTSATNNGVEGFYDYWTEKGNVLTIDSAVLGYCSYQPFNFSASDHVEILSPRFPMDKFIAMFLATIINKEQYRYNYGRKASQSRLKQRSILLPVKDDLPDWEWIRSYIKACPYSGCI